ncbi:hypothetical protein LIL_50025 (plasmid) [Leptospira interrogans serovar Linhai str. 56609]|uniref:Uncharacterized protein n=1 Tax=Leptospira interrogans serovar Zanoni str. LT2156 TaxID=1001601 RepID=M6HAF9_LEPIR|nr:hypothetical protein [Leptospira interrogans]EMM94303.1 hypothetical protein LEP1GSC158_0604 [Leptospira interrogans serovar Zanoni str. LT2156]AJR16691.1 hypothetical protein LIL_50025 [Leptospira interrogans serovar Linhai str. 56609]KGE21820.1 hypothetical protein IQ65_22045 [Leptospira interrogans serovar Lai]ULG86690.1 hypothetical protein FH594_21845 [Leptospira interrogans]ULG86709.1 hypothetical protein FH594_21955 [Leptospira interrogans]
MDQTGKEYSKKFYPALIKTEDGEVEIPVFRSDVGLHLRLSKVNAQINKIREEYIGLFAESFQLIDEAYQDYLDNIELINLDKKPDEKKELAIDKIGFATHYTTLADPKFVEKIDKCETASLAKAEEFLNTLLEKFRVLVHDSDSYIDIFNSIPFSGTDFTGLTQFTNSLETEARKYRGEGTLKK